MLETAKMQQFQDRAILHLVDRWVRNRYPYVVQFPRWVEPAPPRERCLAVPLAANDKFVWRKVFDRDPRFTVASDKLACKRFVAERLPEVPMARILWEGTDPARIPKRLLKGNVMVKANHGCSTNIAVRNGKPGKQRVVERMRRYLAEGHGGSTLQWGYFNVPRKVFVEELLVDGAPLQELKFYMFGRRIERLLHINDRFGDLSANGREPDDEGRLQLLDYPTAIGEDNVLQMPLPECFPQAERIARRLGEEFDHIRVDLLTDGPNLWMGELTVYNLGGQISHTGHDPTAQISRAWDIRKSWFLTTPQPGWRGRYAAALRRRLDQLAETAPPLPPA